MPKLKLYDLTAQMLRRFSTFVLIVAALIAVEPLLHNHPLLEQTRIPSPCAVCVAGTAPLPQVTVAPAAPQVVVYTLAAATVTLVAEAVETAIPSRAPPV